MNRPQISVVISTHNRGRLLNEALASALAQRHVDMEVVVVDNGSTDDTPARLRQCSDERVRIIRNDRSLGATGGRNTGLEQATGRWVGFLDDDDLWAPDKLQAQLLAAEDSGRAWIYTGCVYIDSRRRLLGGVPPPPPERVLGDMPVRYVIPGGISSMVWRRDALEGDGLLDERLQLTADWDLGLRLCRVGPPAWVPRPLVAYRQHGENLSRQAAGFEHELSLVESKFEDLRGDRLLDRGIQQRFVGSQALLTGARWDAVAAYYRGFRHGDRGSITRALAVLTPSALHPWLRRRFLSDGAWLREARRWLGPPIAD